jgi:hypothetical protein
MSKQFWFQVSNDYRSGTSVYTFEKGPNEDEDRDEDESDYEDSAPEEAFPITLPLPENCRIYVICEYPYYKIVDYVDVDKESDCKKVYYKMFSQIHDCMPFVVSGYTSSYKEEGEYPEVPEEIKNMKDIQMIEDLKEEMESGDNVYFVIAIDEDGEEIFTEMLNFLG